LPRDILSCRMKSRNASRPRVRLYANPEAPFTRRWMGLRDRGHSSTTGSSSPAGEPDGIGLGHRPSQRTHRGSQPKPQLCRDRDLAMSAERQSRACSTPIGIQLDDVGNGALLRSSRVRLHSSWGGRLRGAGLSRLLTDASLLFGYGRPAASVCLAAAVTRLNGTGSIPTARSLPATTATPVPASASQDNARWQSAGRRTECFDPRSTIP